MSGEAGAGGDSSGRPSFDRRRGLALFAFLFAVYNVNLRQVSSGDTLMARYVPIAILRDGTLALDGLLEADLKNGRRILEGWVLVSDGHMYDGFPPVAPLLALPVYAPFVWLGWPADHRLLSNLASKLAASIFVALSGMLLFAALREVGCEAGAAWSAALVYGVATSAWSTASQGLWTHSPAVLTISVALLFLVRRRPALAGTALAVATVARPALVPLIPILVSHAFFPPAAARSLRDRVVAWMRFQVENGLGAASVLVVASLYNYWLSGNVMGSNALRNAQLTRIFQTHDFGGSLFAGFLGLLVSPNRGLFVFSPVLAFAVWGAARAWTDRGGSSEADLRRLARFASAGCLVVLLVYSKYLTWWGGDSFGPRYLTDVMPLAAVPLAVAIAGLRSGPWRAAFAALLGWSVFVQTIGAFCWPSTWNRGLPPAHERLWDWRRTEIATCLAEGPRFDPFARKILLKLGIPVPDEAPAQRRR
jgi:hypothetical protein